MRTPLLITQPRPEARLIAGVSTANVFPARWLSASFGLLNVFLGRAISAVE